MNGATPYIRRMGSFVNDATFNITHSWELRRGGGGENLFTNSFLFINDNLAGELETKCNSENDPNEKANGCLRSRFNDVFTI